MRRSKPGPLLAASRARTTDESDWAGIAVFDATPEEADRLLQDDPGVKAGVFTYELVPAFGFPGSALS